MKISSNTMILFIAFSAAIAACGVYFMYYKPQSLIGEQLLNIGLSVAQILGTLLMLRFATITKTQYWKILKFLFGTSCLGAMFKILHFQGADILLILSQFGIASTYLIRFISKPKKGHLDILKVLWILSAFVVMPLIIVHWIDRQYSYISLSLFWLTFIDFVLSEKRLRPFIR